MTNLNSISERVEWLQKKSGLTKRAFSLGIGLDPANYDRKVKGSQNWTEKDVRKFTEHGVNQEWLETGEGEPYEKKEDLKQKEEDTRPRMNVYANAGQLTAGIDSYSEQIAVIRQFPKYDFTIIVHGDSMEPVFSSGEEVACRDVTKTGFLQWGQPHVLNTSQGVILKRIFEGEGGIVCRSDNDKYPDFLVPSEEIYTLGLVIGKIHIY